MLEKLRKQGASFVIYLIFGLLIVIFGINFGTQSVGAQEGCHGSSSTQVLEVDGTSVGEASWRWAFSVQQGGGREVARARRAMEMLLLRELLAQEAERRGLAVSEDLVDQRIKKGDIYLAGAAQDIKSYYFQKIDDQYFFDYDAFKRFVGGLNVGVATYKVEQRRELLAQMMASILRGSPTASRDEALGRYLHENNTVTFDAVRFDPSLYRAAMKLTDADVDRYLASHDAEVKKRYDDEKDRAWKGLKPQIKVRQIYVAKAPPKADTPAPGATPPADGAPAAPAVPAASAAPAVDTAKAQIEQARADIVAGKKSFAEVAKTMNGDEPTRGLAGDLGWRTVDATALPDPALNDAVKALKPGDVSPVIATSGGYYLLTVEAKREGDIAYDAARREIALELARDAWPREAAKRAALDSLAKAREGKGKNLEEMFERAPEQPGGFQMDQIQQILNDPKLSPEDKQKILQMLQGGQHGALEWESANIPAEWGQDTAAAPTGGAPATPPPAAPAAGAPAAPAATAPAAPAEVTASSDTLPAFSDVEKPSIERIGPMVRDRENIERLGKSRELIRAVFDELSPGMIGPRVYEVDGAFVVVQLQDKKLAKVDDFDKQADRLVANLASERGEQLLSRWIAERCHKLVAEKKIEFSQDKVAERDPEGRPTKVTYRPCESMQVE